MKIENPPSERDEDQGGVSRYHFEVEERFSGVDANEIDVYSGRGGADCSFHFQEGKQYVVFPYRADDGRLVATVCSNTRLTSDAKAFLPQLRAVRDGQKVASLYGILRRTQQPYENTQQADFDQPIGQTEVRLVIAAHVIRTKTDDDGVFAFYDVPGGKYSFQADLPPTLELAQTILSDPLPPIELPDKACFENDLEALPTGRIRGRVLGSDGKPVKSAPVELFRADQYKEGERGWWEYQGDKEMSFEFEHVSPGDYIIVFNNLNRIDPYAPYPRTFYPGVTEFAQAERIHLGEGEQLANADIHLSGGKPTRELIIRVTGDEAHQPGGVMVSAKATLGDSPLPYKVSEHIFRLSLLRDADYTIFATYFCDAKCNDGYCRPSEAETPHVKVSGSDDSISELTLTFDGNQCH